MRPSRSIHIWSVRLLILMLSAAVAWPAAAATVSLWNPTPQSFDKGGGNQLDVVAPITLAPADGVTSMDFVFTYDPAVLTATSVHRTGFTNAFNLTYSVSPPGTVTLSLVGGSPLQGSGEVAWIVFHVNGAAGTSSDLSWSSAVLNSGSIPADSVDGRVNVVAANSTLSTPDDAKGSPGSLVQVPVSGQPMDGVSAIDLRLAFNPNVVAPTIVETTPFTQTMTLTYNLAKPGEAIISLFQEEPLTGSGQLVLITYQVLGTIGDRTPLNLTRGDLNENRVTSVLDDGLFTVCDSIDRDGDGITGCAGDCDDTDRNVYPGATEVCNGRDDDCDQLIDEGITAPTGRPVLTIAKSGSSASLSWTGVTSATGYDVVRGDLGTLRTSGGDFTQATDRCLADDLAATSVQDPALPVSGAAFWYLVRAVNCGGGGTYDTTAPAQQGRRDAEIAASSAACP